MFGVVIKVALLILLVIPILSTSALAQTTLDDNLIKITGNGSESVNQINIEKNDQNIIRQSNSAVIDNRTHCNVNTGGNLTNENTDKGTTIATGDSNCVTSIQNQANINQTELKCESCVSTPPSSTPTPSNTISIPTVGSGGGPSNGESSSSSGGGPGESAGGESTVQPAPAGVILPETGDNSTAILTLISLSLLGAGWYLKITKAPWLNHLITKLLGKLAKL